MIGDDSEMLELKNRCVPLIFDCPRKVSSQGCPFRVVREDQDVVSRVNWIKAQSADKLRAVLKHHSSCIEAGRE